MGPRGVLTGEEKYGDRRNVLMDATFQSREKQSDREVGKR